MRTAKRIISIIVLSAIVLPMAACGTDPGERSLSGAGIGAAGGGVAALLGAPLIPALLVGAGVGAVAGAVTSPKQVNLDR